jgi:hypothetical protein
VAVLGDPVGDHHQADVARVRELRAPHVLVGVPEQDEDVLAREVVGGALVFDDRVGGEVVQDAVDLLDGPGLPSRRTTTMSARCISDEADVAAITGGPNVYIAPSCVTGVPPSCVQCIDTRR